MKYRLVEETQALPTVSAIFTPTFPSGHFRLLNPGLLGIDAIGGEPMSSPRLESVQIRQALHLLRQSLVLHADCFDTRGEDEDGNSSNIRNYPRDFVTVNLAAEYPITKKWVACLELTSTWDGGRLFGHQANLPPTALLSLSPEIEYMATDKFSLALGVNIDLAGKNNSANITPLFSMVYAF